MFNKEDALFVPTGTMGNLISCKDLYIISANVVYIYVYI